MFNLNLIIMETKTNKIDITQVGVGMIWYEDDTFSFDKLVDKKIKAVVELVKDGVIYGDLTASELVDVKEERLNWAAAQRYIQDLSYPCKDNEKVINYDFSPAYYASLQSLTLVSTFRLIGKRWRHGMYWTSREYEKYWAFAIGFGFANIQSREDKGKVLLVRPVLALKVE